ncbi:MAG: flagellar FliJ family protein [Buchnera aphidicola (Nurudea shiraii)]
MILEKIILNKKKVQEQIDLLLKYKDEYFVKLNLKMCSGISGFELKNYDNFISSLVHGIKNQKKIIERYKQQYSEYFNLWRKNQCRLKMWNIMHLKILKHNLKLIQLDEQIQLDEHVQKSFFKKR